MRVDRKALLACLAVEDPELGRVLGDLFAASDRARRHAEEQLQRIHDLRVEIRSWSGRPPPPRIDLDNP